MKKDLISEIIIRETYNTAGNLQNENRITAFQEI